MEQVDERVPTVIKSKAEVESDSKVFKERGCLHWCNNEYLLMNYPRFQIYKQCIL